MRPAIVALGLGILGAVPSGGSTAHMGSHRPGAEVWASPLDQPVISRNGTTLCTIQLPNAGTPHSILIRGSLCLDVYRQAEPDLATVEPTLDDPQSRLHIPGVPQRLDIDVERQAAMAPCECESLIGGLLGWPDSFYAWTPDASSDPRLRPRGGAHLQAPGGHRSRREPATRAHRARSDPTAHG